jgi:Tol biopolymer transport system component
MKTIRIALVAAVLAVLGGGLAFTQSGQDLFQQALVKEQADGDLRGAIVIYQRIVRDFSADRALAAKALVQIGHCYDRLGQADAGEARKAYERVVREFADQKDAAEEARALLGRRATGIAVPTGASMRVDRRVWSGPDVGGDGRISPDGRLLSYTDWETGDLAVHDFTTGKNRRVTSKGSWAVSSECADISIISPAGSQILHNWYNKDGYYDLRVVGIDGAKPRVVYPNRERLAYITPLAWFPDGSRVLVEFMKEDETRESVLVSLADGSVRAIRTGSKGPVPWPVLSPDGRFIAYSLADQVSLMDLETGRESVLIPEGARSTVLAWAPDGRHLIFVSSRGGGRDMWLLEVADGRPLGEPRRIKENFSGYGLGFARSGAFYYAVSEPLQDVKVTELDPADRETVSVPKPVSRRWVGVTRSPDWSPDGKSLAYMTTRPAGSIIIRAADTGEERELRTGAQRFGVVLRWAPDSKSLITTVLDGGTQWKLARVDARTAEVTSLMPWPAEQGAFPRFDVSPDGTTIFQTKGSFSDPNASALVAIDLESKREKTLLSRKGLTLVAVSPDGQRLAVTWSDNLAQALLVLPATGGAAREVARVPADQANWRVGPVWMPDGRSIIFAKGLKGRPTRKVELWRVPAEGGTPQPLGLSFDELWWLRIHPDGHRVALGGWQSKLEVWMMENFLPVPAGKGK